MDRHRPTLLPSTTMRCLLAAMRVALSRSSFRSATVSPPGTSKCTCCPWHSSDVAGCARSISRRSSSSCGHRTEPPIAATKPEWPAWQRSRCEVAGVARGRAGGGAVHGGGHSRWRRSRASADRFGCLWPSRSALSSRRSMSLARSKAERPAAPAPGLPRHRLRSSARRAALPAPGLATATVTPTGPQGRSADTRASSIGPLAIGPDRTRPCPSGIPSALGGARA